MEQAERQQIEQERERQKAAGIEVSARTDLAQSKSPYDQALNFLQDATGQIVGDAGNHLDRLRRSYAEAQKRKQRKLTGAEVAADPEIAKLEQGLAIAKSFNGALHAKLRSIFEVQEDLLVERYETLPLSAQRGAAAQVDAILYAVKRRVAERALETLTAYLARPPDTYSAEDRDRDVVKALVGVGDVLGMAVTAEIPEQHTLEEVRLRQGRAIMPLVRGERIGAGTINGMNAAYNAMLDYESQAAAMPEAALKQVREAESPRRTAAQGPAAERGMIPGAEPTETAKRRKKEQKDRSTFRSLETWQKEQKERQKKEGMIPGGDR